MYDPSLSSNADDESSLRWLPFWAAFGAALAIRLAFLDVRPLHHDEGVNAWLLSRLLAGFRYAYDPEKFHGPFLIFFVLPFVRLLGESVLVLRLPVALASASMVPLLLPLRRRLGVAGVTAAAWLLALSPSFVLYGRDLIHETFLAVLTLALVVAVSSWLETRREGWLLLSAVCLGLLATVKETYVLTLAVLAIAAVLARAWAHGRPGFGACAAERQSKDIKDSKDGKDNGETETSLLSLLSLGSFRRSPFLRRRLLGELWGRIRPGIATRAAAAFAVPYVLLYTSFFTNPRGLPDSVRTFLLWTGKGLEGAGHAKPWDYFPRLLLSFEPVTVGCAVAGAWLALRRRDAFGSFCALWAAGELAAYSLLRYKTPWLGLNILLPAVLAAGVLGREILSRRAPAVLRRVLACTLFLGLGWEGWRAVEVSFVRFDDTRLALVYVPTHRDVDELVAEVRAAARRIPPGSKPAIRIMGRYAWPLPWYFRRLSGMKYSHGIPPHPDGDILIIERAWEGRLRPLLRQRYQRREYLLRPGEPVAVYVNERLGKARQTPGL